MAVPERSKELRPICYEHHVVMRKIELLVESASSSELDYACPEPDCGVCYGRARGYFIVPANGQAESDATPRITCVRDGRRMYLAEINPEKRDFRLWRCPQCNWTPSNEERLVDNVSRQDQA